MNKNNLIKISFRFVPFVVGVILYVFGIVNLLSSLLLFVGGYVVVKSTLDYRNVRKNMKMIYPDRVEVKNVYSKEMASGYNYHKINRNIKVRKRTK